LSWQSSTPILLCGYGPHLTLTAQHSDDHGFCKSINIMRLKWVPSPRGTYHGDYLNNRSVRGSDDMNGKWDNLREIITIRTDRTTWTVLDPRRISSLMSPNLYVGAPLYSLFILWSPNIHLSGHDLSYLRTNEYIVFFFKSF